MNTRRFFLIGGGLAALAACSPPSAPEATTAQASAAPDPAATIRPLYDRYLHPPAAETPWPALEDSAPWSDELKAQLIAMMARSNARNEPILDFDPIIGAQDGQFSNLTVTTDAVSENSHAVVRAQFTNVDRQDTILYDLIWQDGAWRIDNVRGADWDLRQVIAG